MYLPPAFHIDCPESLQAFLRRYSFATLVTGGCEPFVTHLPLLLDPERGSQGTLVGHFARANPHWQLDHLQYSSLAIFQGPHAYISPSWYRSSAPAVPTWNYTAVHVAGKLTILDDANVAKTLLNRMVAIYDGDQATSPHANQANQLSPESLEKLLGGIVAFEMPIEHLEGKFKLSQNRVPEDQAGALAGLMRNGDPESLALAEFMQRQLTII